MMGQQMNQEETSTIDFESISVLIPRVRDGDEQAFEQLLGQMNGYLAAMARRKLSPHLVAKEGHSDVVQTTLVKVVASFDSFRGNSAGEFNNWLKRILENTVTEVHRRYNATKRDFKNERPIAGMKHPGIASLEQTPATRAAANDEIRKFHLMLDKLSDDHAQVIRLRSLNKMSFQEVAAEMGRSSEAVSKLWSRAMLKLGSLMEKDSPG